MDIKITDILIFVAVGVGGIVIAAFSNWIQNREDKGRGRDTGSDKR